MIRISVKYTLFPKDTLWVNGKIIRYFEKFDVDLKTFLRKWVFKNAGEIWVV